MQSMQQEAGTASPVLQQSVSSPTHVNDLQAHPRAGSQADPPTDQQNLPRLRQTAANQYLQQQQQHDEAQQLQQPLNSKQQHGSTSDTPQSATEATRARPSPDAWLSQQAGGLTGGPGQSVEPVAVFTSAVTGAGLRELLLQVERKVCALLQLHACSLPRNCTVDKSFAFMLHNPAGA